MTPNPGHENFDVVPSLIDLLAEAMQEVEKKRGDIKKAHKAVADHLPVGPRQVRRYLRDRDSSPTAGELDALVTAVAAEAGQRRLDLWRRALATVEKDVELRGGDPRQEAAEAAVAAPPEEPGPDDSE